MFLTQGNTGTSVKNCQYTLHMLTYNVNGIDGSFGPGMTAAVRLYQQNNGLTVNGNIDTTTWNSLVSNITPIKQYLRAKGFYLVSSFYGVGDGALYDAVLAFQRSNGLAADGMVGPATRIKLFSSGSGNTVVGDNEFPLVQGDSGDNVRYAYCPYGKTWYVNNQRYYSRSSGYKPKRGDIVFFWGGTEISHTGVVVSSTSTTVTTIEGNASRMVKKCTYDLTNTYIDGYGTFSATPPAPLTKEEEEDEALDAFNDVIKTLGITVDSPPLLKEEIVIPAGIFTIRLKAEHGRSLVVKEAEDQGYGTLNVSNGSIMYQGSTVHSNLLDMFSAISIEGIGSVPSVIFTIGTMVNDGVIYYKFGYTEDGATFGIVFERSTIARDEIKVTSSYSLKISMDQGLYGMALNWAKAEYEVNFGTSSSIDWESLLNTGIYVLSIGLIAVVCGAVIIGTSGTAAPVIGSIAYTYSLYF